MEDFARRFPDSPASRDFARAAASADLYAGVEAWHAAAAPWAADPAPAGERQADQRLEAVRAFLRDHPTSPLGPRTRRTPTTSSKPPPRWRCRTPGSRAWPT